MKINESKLKVQIANICSLSPSHWPGDCTHGEPPRSNKIVRLEFLSFFSFSVHLSLLVALVHFLRNPVPFFCHTSFVLCLPIELSIVCTQTFNVEACSYWTFQFFARLKPKRFGEVFPAGHPTLHLFSFLLPMAVRHVICMSSLSDLDLSSLCNWG